MKILYTLLFLCLTWGILSHSQLSLAYALLGLDLWFNKMVPALFPFMILSGIMIRMNLTKHFSKLLFFLIGPIFRVSENVCYAMIMGFLCGFPMGAKTISDLWKRNLISQREGEFLLAFCNNIGPVYFCSYVLPLLGKKLVFPYLFGMYGLPVFYGLLLRYTTYKDLSAAHESNTVQLQPEGKKNILTGMDDAITSSIQSIMSLGGYMILFNLLNILPHIILNKTPIFLAPLLEITGGLKLMNGQYALYGLILLPFGGFSCIAQTYSCIKGTALSIADYTLHKIILTALTIIYYLLWFLLFPASFLL